VGFVRHERVGASLRRNSVLIAKEAIRAYAENRLLRKDRGVSA